MATVSRIIALAAFICASAVLTARSAQAQSASEINSAAQQSERIQREQLQRQQDDINRDAESTRPAAHIDVPAPSPQQGHGTGCRNIRRIEFKSTVHMTRGEFLKLAVPYAGRCLGVSDIEALLSDVTRFYVGKGYSTTRVYLQPQDLTTGILEIKVLAGTVGKLKTDAKQTQINYLTDIFPGVIDNDFNLRDFEQGIDQLNRLSSNNATLDIQPGDTPGESIVTINNQRTKFWHVNVAGDNYGTPSTGKTELSSTLSLDNLTGLNDFLSVTGRKTVPFGDQRKQASSGSGFYSVPFGYATLSAGVTGSDYDSTLHTPGGTELHLNGDDRTLFTTLDDVVYRDQTGKISVNATLNNEKSDNFIADQKLTVSSRTLTSAQFGTGYDGTLLGGTINAGLAYTRGLSILNALKDASDLPGEAPRAQFNKFTVTGGYSRPFSAAQQKFLFSTQFAGQYAPDTLYGTEQFSIGGVYSVRGFDQEELANDDGYYVRNDLTLLKTLGGLYGRTISFRPFIAFDFGSVGSRNFPGGQTGTLGGAAIGADLAYGPLDVNFYTGYPIIYPSTVNNERINSFARVSLTF